MSSDTPSQYSDCSSLSLKLEGMRLEPERHSNFDLSRFYMTLSVGGKEKRTIEAKSTRWPSPLEIVSVSPSMPIDINVNRAGLGFTRSIGRYRGTVKDLINNSGSDVSLFLDKQGGKRLFMSVTHNSTEMKETTNASEDAREFAKQALDAAGNLSSGSSAAQIKSMAQTAESVQQIAGKAFEAAKSLPEASIVSETLRRIGIFVDIVDGFADIHPYVNAAWKVLSAVYRVWQTHAQQVQSIRDLAESLCNMLDFVELGKEIQELEKGMKVITDMWEVIKDAAHIIEEFCKNSSSVVNGTKQAIRKKVEEDVENTQKRFSRLRADLDSVVGFQTLKKIQQVINVVEMNHAEELSKVERELIERLPSARVLKAEYDRVEPALKGTRTKLLNTLWKELTDTNPGTPRIIWVSGLAGTGKSTISATIARTLDEQNLLAGNFFFSRSEKDRSNPELVFPAVARQFASFPPLRHSTVKTLQKNDIDITNSYLPTQFLELIETPLRGLEKHTSPVIVVLDALDECFSPDSFLEIIEKNHSKLPSCFKIFLTSRPGNTITSLLQRMGGAVREHSLIQSDSDVEDIRLAFEDRLSDISNKYRLQDDWPGTEQLQKLVERANGLFIWMSTVCKFIKERDPLGRLELTLGINTDDDDNPFAALDDLYLRVLQDASPKGHSKSQQRLRVLFRNIVGTMVVTKIALSEMELIQVLNIQVNDFRQTIEGLGALLHIPKEPAEPIQILHSSFIDFATRRERCKDDCLFIKTDDHHQRLALRCLQIMNNESNGLRENICGIDFTLFNSEVGNLPFLVSQCIPGALQYACRFWADHLDHCCDPDEEINSSLKTFYEVHFLHWLEILSVLGRFDSVHISLVIGQKWVREHFNRNSHQNFQVLVDDCGRFAMEFREPISKSALHVYHSALPFTGKKTQLYRNYSTRCEPNISVRSTGAENWSSCLAVLEGHTKIKSGIFSPDGTRIVSCAYDKTLRLWDGLTGAPIGDAMIGHSSWVMSATFSPDGMRIMSCSGDYTLRLWDGLTGAPIGDVMTGHSESVLSATFSPDGMRILSRSGDNTLRLWDGLTATPIGEAMTGQSGWVLSAEFSPDGMRIVSCSDDSTLRLWDGLTGAPVGNAMKGHSDSIVSTTFSPDGTHLVSCAYDKTLRLWNGLTGTPIGNAMNGHSDSVVSVIFSPDGMRILSCSNDHTLRLWDGRTGAPFGNAMHRHLDVVWFATFSPDGKRILSCSRDHILWLWDGLTGAPIGDAMIGHSDTVVSATFSPNGMRILSYSRDNTLRLWDGLTSTPIGEAMDGHSDWVCSAEFSPDGMRIVSCSDDKTIRLWDGLTGAPIGDAMYGHLDVVWSATFSPNGKRILSCSKDDTLRLWDGLTGAQIEHARHGHLDIVWSATFSPDGARIVSHSKDNTLRLWDGLTGAPIGDSMNGHSNCPNPTILIFSPNGKRLLSYLGDNTLRLWDGMAGTPIGAMCGHSSWIRSAVFSLDGLRIVSCSDDRTLRLWDGLAGIPIGDAMHGHFDVVWFATFSPDGKRILSCSRDDTLRLWDGLTGASLGYVMNGHLDSVWSAAFSPDGTRIVSCSDDGTLRLWDGLTGAPIGGAMNGHLSRILSTTFSPDGMQIVSRSDDNTLRLWDGLTGTPIGDAMHGHSDHFLSAIFSPDGAHILSTSTINGVLFWGVEDQMQISPTRDIFETLHSTSVSFTINKGWVHVPGGKQKLWWMPVLNRGVVCSMTDGRLWAGSRNGDATFVDGRRAMKLWL